MNIDSNLKLTFNDPLENKLNQNRTIALGNLVKLAQERLWQVGGRPLGAQYEDFDDGMTIDDIENARRSIEIVEQLLLSAQIKNSDESEEN